MAPSRFAGTGPRVVKGGIMTAESPQRDDFANLYRRAFAAYGTHVLWNKRALENPTKDDALVIARGKHGCQHPAERATCGRSIGQSPKCGPSPIAGQVPDLYFGSVKETLIMMGESPR